jgi:hypothetical protein
MSPTIQPTAVVCPLPFPTPPSSPLYTPTPPLPSPLPHLPLLFVSLYWLLWYIVYPKMHVCVRTRGISVSLHRVLYCTTKINVSDIITHHMHVHVNIYIYMQHSLYTHVHTRTHVHNCVGCCCLPSQYPIQLLVPAVAWPGLTCPGPSLPYFGAVII